MEALKRIAPNCIEISTIYGFLVFSGIICSYRIELENIIPSLQSIFIHVFTPAAAVGGFWGTSVAAALTRGVNRGLYSNEAGQGSALLHMPPQKLKIP